MVIGDHLIGKETARMLGMGTEVSVRTQDALGNECERVESLKGQLLSGHGHRGECADTGCTQQ